MAAYPCEPSQPTINPSVLKTTRKGSAGVTRTIPETTTVSVVCVSMTMLELSHVAPAPCTETVNKENGAFGGVFNLSLIPKCTVMSMSAVGVNQSNVP